MQEVGEVFLSRSFTLRSLDGNDIGVYPFTQTFLKQESHELKIALATEGHDNQSIRD